MSNKKNQHRRITITDYIKAVKKADRDIQLEQGNGGWVRTTNIHQNKKQYNRKRDKKNLGDID